MSVGRVRLTGGPEFISVNEFMKGRSYAHFMDEGTEAHREHEFQPAGLGGGVRGEGRFVWLQLRADGKARGRGSRTGARVPRGGGSVLVGGAGRQTGRGLAAAAAAAWEGAGSAGELAGRLHSAGRESAGSPELVRPARALGCAPWFPGSEGPRGSRALLPPDARWALRSPRLRAPQSGLVRGSLPLERIWAPVASVFSSVRCRQRR